MRAGTPAHTRIPGISPHQFELSLRRWTSPVDELISAAVSANSAGIRRRCVKPTTPVPFHRPSWVPSRSHRHRPFINGHRQFSIASSSTLRLKNCVFRYLVDSRHVISALNSGNSPPSGVRILVQTAFPGIGGHFEPLNRALCTSRVLRFSEAAVVAFRTLISRATFRVSRSAAILKLGRQHRAILSTKNFFLRLARVCRTTCT